MNPNRREFLVGAAAGSALLGAGSLRRGPVYAEDPTLASTARRQAAHRRRRVILNNDGDDIWAPGVTTRDKFLAVRHAPLLKTHVDSIYYCTTQSFNHFTHQTEIAEIFTAKGGEFADNQLATFLQEETDGLRMSSEFARQHGLESFWTLRMNDVHDVWTAAYRPRWKREDPTRIMSTPEEAQGFNDRRQLWSLVDFEHPDVEPRLIAIVEEVLTSYDIDGVELDFLRAPFYFRTSYHGEAVTESQVAIMTRLVRKVRELVLRESRRQGKPLLLAARVPSTVALCRKIGIDIGAWLHEKLIDVMNLGGGYITFDVPVTELLELGHQHDVPVYPCLSQSGLMHRPPRGSSTSQPLEAWFGAAARLWHDGADGIYTFNLFPGPGGDESRQYARSILGRIGSAEQLSQTTTMYAISDAGWWMPAHFWAKDAADFSRALPLQLKPDTFERSFLYVPEDLRGAGFDVTAELRVDFTGLTEESAPQILFGSANFGNVRDSEVVADVRRYTCPVPLPAISPGPNRVMVKTSVTGARLAGVELWVQR